MEGHVVHTEKIKYFYTIILAVKYHRVKPLEIIDVEHRTIFEGVCVCVCVCVCVHARASSGCLKEFSSR